MTARIVETFAAPGTEAWQTLLTPSKVPPILGISRWQSQYTSWQIEAGNVSPEPISDSKQDDFDYGHAAELAAAEYWKFKNPGWRLSRREVQYFDDALPFPNAATIDRRASRGSRRKIVEIKTARDLNEYGDDGSGEVPADYAAQIITQQRITGFTDPADLVLWPQYGKPRIYTVEYNPDVAEAIIRTVIAWQKGIAAGVPPALDDSVSTYETVKRMHPDIDGREVQLDQVLAADFLTAVAEEKAIKKRLRGLKTRVLDAMGTAETALVYREVIATRSPHGSGGTQIKANADADPTNLGEAA
ncbi:MAG: hypothetical protein EOP24_27520 [Hyphomicrobiales bacterium]|nr:MAG: hypothetical protein EOP24_27520 [Hyphomicrobiales bacterium]